MPSANRPRPRHYHNSSKVYLRRRVAKFAAATEPGMLVLDAGAGKSPYRKLFDHAKYLSEVRRLESGWRLVYLAPLLLGTRLLAGLLHTVYFRADVHWNTKRGMAKNYVVVAHRQAA